VLDDTRPVSQADHGAVESILNPNVPAGGVSPPIPSIHIYFSVCSRTNIQSKTIMMWIRNNQILYILREGAGRKATQYSTGGYRDVDKIHYLRSKHHDRLCIIRTAGSG
jgi:hypothetical protein